MRMLEAWYRNRKIGAVGKEERVNITVVNGARHIPGRSLGGKEYFA